MMMKRAQIPAATVAAVLAGFALACGGGGGGGGLPGTGGTGGGGGGTPITLNIVSVSPSSGSIAGGTTVVINAPEGLRTPGTVLVTIGGVAATGVTVVSDTRIDCVTGAATAGAADVEVAIRNGTTVAAQGVLAGAFTYIDTGVAQQGPTVTRVDPPTGLRTGGQQVRLYGTNFKSGARVSFGTTLGDFVVVQSSLVIDVTTPQAMPLGLTSVTVTNTDGLQGVQPNGFEFVDPVTLAGKVAAAPVTQGTVYLLGVNAAEALFQVANGITGTLGEFSMSAGAYRGPGLLEVRSGSYAEESDGTTVNVQADNPLRLFLPDLQQSEATLSITPLSTIAANLAIARLMAMPAANYADATNQAQTANAQVAAMFTVADVLRTQPVNLTTPPGAALTAADPTVEAAFVIAAFSEAARTLTTNSLLLTRALGDDLAFDGTLNGAGNDGTGAPQAITLPPQGATLPAAFLNGTPGGTTDELPAAISAFETNSRNLSGLGAGSMTALVTRLQGSGTTVTTPPTLTGINPAAGSYAGGDAVTLTGTGFEAAVTVTVGGKPATGITVVGPTTITCTTPAGTIGKADVVVVNTLSGLSASALQGYEYLNTNTPPVVNNVTVQTPAPRAGDLTIAYDLVDPDAGALCDLTFYYRGGQRGTNWTVASTTPGTSGVQTGIAPGTGRTVVWHSATDEGTTAATDYQFRIVPTDGQPGAATEGLSALFAVDNGGGAVTNSPPTVSNVAAPGTPPLSGDVTISFDLADGNGDSCTLTVEYRGGGLTTWTNALLKSGTISGVTPAAGLQIVWDTMTQIPTANAPDFQIRITPADGKAGSPVPGITGAFAVNNTQGGGNQLPRVEQFQLATTPGPYGGNVAFTFNLVDPDSTSLDLDLTYLGGSVSTATAGTTSEALTGWAPGTSLTITWQSKVDQNNQDASFTITLTPKQSGNPGTAATVVVSVDNKAPVFSGTLSPAGGEMWAGGSAQTVTWPAATDSNPGTYQADYTIDAGVTWTTIATGLAWTAASTPWNPVPSLDTNAVKVRVRATDAFGASGTITSNAFTIDSTPPSASALVPNGGETWQIKSVQTVTWTSAPDATPLTAAVDLSNDGFTTNVISILAAGSTDLGTANYTPAAAQVGTGWQVRVTLTDGVGNTGSVTSAGTFVIEYILQQVQKTTQAHFAAGWNSGVDVNSSPGDVQLIATQVGSLGRQKVNRIVAYDRSLTGSTWIACTTHGAFLTTNGGTSFTHFTTHSTGATPAMRVLNCLAADFYAPNPNGAVAPSYPPPAAPAGFTDPAGQVFALGFEGGGVAITRDGGLTFQTITAANSQLPFDVVRAIAFLNNWQSQGRIFVVATPSGAVLTTDGGVTFSVFATSNPTYMAVGFHDQTRDVDLLDADPTGNTLLVGGDNQLFATSNALTLPAATFVQTLSTSSTKYSRVNSCEFLQADTAGTTALAAFGQYGASTNGDPPPGNGELFRGNPFTGAGTSWNQFSNLEFAYSNDFVTARFYQPDPAGTTFAAGYVPRTRLPGQDPGLAVTTTGGASPFRVHNDYEQVVAWANGMTSSPYLFGWRQTKTTVLTQPAEANAVVGRSSDYGVSFTNVGVWVTQSIAPSDELADLVYDDADPTGQRFAVTQLNRNGPSGAALYVTNDSGRTFATASYSSFTLGGAYGEDPFAVAFDPTSNGTKLAVAHAKGLSFLTYTAGSPGSLTVTSTKTSANFGTSQSRCAAVEYHRTTGAILVATDEGGLLSANGGTTWKHFNNTVYTGAPFANAGTGLPRFTGVAWLHADATANTCAFTSEGKETIIVQNARTAADGAATLTFLKAGAPANLPVANHWAVDFDESDATGNTLLIGTQQGLYLATNALGGAPTFDLYHDGSSASTGANITDKSLANPALQSPSRDCWGVSYYDFAAPGGSIWAAAFRNDAGGGSPDRGGVFLTRDGAQSFRALRRTPYPPPEEGANKVHFLQNSAAGSSTFAVSWKVGATFGAYGFKGAGNVDMSGPNTVDPAVLAAGTDVFFGMWKLQANVTTPANTAVKWFFYDQNDALIPDSVLAGNSAGLVLTPAGEIDLTPLTAAVLTKLIVRVRLETTDPLVSPTLHDYTLYLRYQ